MELMTSAIVICSRTDSSRIPRKVFYPLQGKRLLEHLIDRALPAGIPILIAIPEEQYRDYGWILSKYDGKPVTLMTGSKEDPLARMQFVAQAAGIRNVIRVCQDKIFMVPELLREALSVFESRDLDYLYSSTFTEGSRFEIISSRALDLAATRFKNVEHVSYAIRAVTDNAYDWPVPQRYRSPHRFLVDYPEDLKLLDLVLSQQGRDCSLWDAIEFMDYNPWAEKLNRLPTLTVYTCAYNTERFVEKALGSVASQVGFRDFEYLLVDDFSSDRTPALMAKFASLYPNVKYIRNQANLGLASSSNVALSQARGKYILRLDSDDYLARPDALRTLVDEITSTERDAIYPANYFGSMRKVQPGREQHHIGGAIFRRSAVNHVKFTEKLRGWEGFDFFERARHQLKIGYLTAPTFFYRQRKGSLSHGDAGERAAIRREIEARLAPG